MNVVCTGRSWLYIYFPRILLKEDVFSFLHPIILPLVSSIKIHFLFTFLPTPIHPKSSKDGRTQAELKLEAGQVVRLSDCARR